MWWTYRDPSAQLTVPLYQLCRIIHMKLVITGFLFVLSITALRAQNVAVNPTISTGPLGGYLVVYPQVPLITIRFDGNSEDIAKTISTHPSNGFNHDGTALKGYV